MFDFLSIQEESKPKEKAPITEFYTTAEVKEKYNVVDSWILRAEDFILGVEDGKKRFVNEVAALGKACLLYTSCPTS